MDKKNFLRKKYFFLRKKNYFNIESWWESKMVKNARLSFLNYSGVIDQNVARLKWIEYLKNLE